MQQSRTSRFTLIKGKRKPAAQPGPFPDNHLQKRDSHTHSNPLVRYMVTEAREQLPPKRRKLNDYSCNRLATVSALAALNYLCTHLNETKDMRDPRAVVARDLAMIIAQLEESHGGVARERWPND
ncbi:MAG: hypothetical protein AB7F61_09045 [Desulfobulbus sp.]